MQFYGYDMPVDENNIALELMTRHLNNRGEQMDPCLHLYWRSASSIDNPRVEWASPMFEEDFERPVAACAWAQKRRLEVVAPVADNGPVLSGTPYCLFAIRFFMLVGSSSSSRWTTAGSHFSELRAST